MPPIAKGMYGRAYWSANNKDRQTCNACIVKSTNGSIENQGIQSNQDVHVYGIWWMGVFVANLFFFGNNSLLKLFRKDMGYLYYSLFFHSGRQASSTHCFNYWDTCLSFTPFSSFIFLHSHMYPLNTIND